MFFNFRININFINDDGYVLNFNSQFDKRFIVINQGIPSRTVIFTIDVEQIGISHISYRIYINGKMVKAMNVKYPDPKLSKKICINGSFLNEIVSYHGPDGNSIILKSAL